MPTLLESIITYIYQHMKKVLFSLLFVALSTMTFAQQWTSINKNNPCAPEVKLVSSSEKEVVVEFTLGGFNLTSVDTQNGIENIVSVPKMSSMLEAGSPDLPQFPVPAIIGDMAEMNVSVVKSTYTDYENIEIAPSKGNFSRQIDPETMPYTYGSMYRQDAFYPAVQAYLETPYIIRDFRGQNIMVRPFAYNPMTKTLRVYHDMTIAMKKVSDNGVNQKVARKANSKMSAEMDAAYSHRFINYAESAAKYSFLQDHGEMLVICADQYMEAMQPFVDWKNQSGRPTTMVSVTEAGGNSDTQIKSYIQGIYNDPNHYLGYILLVGDYNHITPHSMSGGRSDNWFGQLEGNDYYLEVLVGRFSVQSIGDVETQVNKVLYYERDMPEGLTWLNKGVGIAANEGAGNGHFGEADYVHINYVRDTLLHYTYETVTQQYSGVGSGTSASAISADINAGTSIINYCNHGSQTSWAVADYSNSDVNALTNDNKLPYIWSVACNNGQFDGTCFGEAWLRATNNSTGVPTGAIGGMFSWISQPWQPPMYGQDEMVDILTEWKSSDKYCHTFGGASLNGNMYVLDAAPSDNGATHNTWILFGDPSLLVRTDNPVSMNLSCSPAALMLGMSTMELTAENTAFGIATLTMNGEVISSNNISNGTCTLSFAPLTEVGTATLTVIGYNKVTEIMPIEILPAEGPYLSVTGSSPNSTAVYKDTEMSLSLKNVGVDPTDGPVTISLSCANPRLTFINDTATCEALAADETVTLENAFTFIIDRNVIDGTRFQIDVTMTDNSNTWTGKVFVTAGQAILDYVGANWGGSFVPGEEVSLVANFQNIGHYMATNAFATISSENEYVTILNDSIAIGTIDPEGLAVCPFQIAIDAECPQTEQIEIAFTLQADNDLIAEGTLVLKNSCVVIVEMNDSWGDGWNGNALKFSFSDGTPDVEFTIEDGASQTKNLEIGNGVHVTITWIRGNYTYECSFSVKYESGDVIYSANNPNTGVLHEFDCNCADGDTPIASFNPVENLTYEIEMTSVSLTWDAPEDAIGYIVMRNGLEIGRTSRPSYIDETDMAINYSYCVIAEYAEGLSNPECVIVDLTSIEESDNTFALYPNPTNGILYINGGDSEFTYMMYNGMGQVVANGKAQGTEQISVEGMAKGVYFIRLTSGTQVHVEKVVVR